MIIMIALLYVLRSKKYFTNEYCAYNKEQFGPIDFWVQYDTKIPMLHQLAIQLFSHVC